MQAEKQIEMLQNQVNILTQQLSDLQKASELQNRLLTGVSISKITPQKELYLEKGLTIRKTSEISVLNNTQAVKVKYIAVVDTEGDSIPAIGSLRYTTGRLNIWNGTAWIDTNPPATP